jgi:hypothetical protein
MDKRMEYVQSELQRRAGFRQLGTVAAQTGIGRRTIGYIMDGRNTRVSTLNTLHDYLKANARRRDL